MDDFGIDENIAQFARRILANDMRDDLLQRQKEEYGQFVKNVLPLDNTSSPSPVIFSQLMKTIGNFHQKFLTKLDFIATNDRQNYQLVCAVGASGMGKTHMAYSLGRIRPCILVRLCEPGSSRPNHLSLPWETARGKIYDFFEHNPVVEAQNNSDKFIHRAKSALKIVKLLIYCYVEGSCIASECVKDDKEKNKEKALEKQRELILRYHRNGVSENQINFLFLKRWEQLFNNNSTEDGPLDDKLCNDYFNTVQELANKELGNDFIICFDEILVLKAFFPNDFVARSYYDNHENSSQNPNSNNVVIDEHLSPILMGEQTEIRPKFAVPRNQLRGLLYATLCCICSISMDTKWRSFVTGTSLSIAQFSSQPHGISPLRGSCFPICPSKLFDIGDMINLLNYYFTWETSTFDNEDVRKALEMCCGRPLFFAKSVFENLLSKIITKRDDKTWKQRTQLDSNDLLQVIKIEDSTYLLTSRLKKLFEDPTVLPNDLSRTTYSLLPLLLEAFLTDDNIIMTDQQMEDAILMGVFPVAHNSCTDSCFRGLEPIVRKSIFAILQSMDSEWETTLKMLSSQSEMVGKGAYAEKLIAIRIVIKSLQHKLKYKNPITLDLILKGFLSDEQHKYIHPQFKQMYCHVDNLVDLMKQNSTTEEDDDGTFLSNFVRPKSKKGVSLVHLYKEAFGVSHKDCSDLKLNYKSLFMNIDTLAGTDISFLVTFGSLKLVANGTCQVVSLQAKNQSDGTLNEALISIHPGTQYLTNAERDYFLKHFSGCKNNDNFPKEGNGKGSCGKNWASHCKFSKKYPFLCKDWVRIAVVARPIEDSLLQKVNELARGKIDDAKWKKERLKCSPIAVVSLHYLNDGNNNSNKGPTDANVTATNSHLSLPELGIDWVPLQIEDVIKIIQKEMKK